MDKPEVPKELNFILSRSALKMAFLLESKVLPKLLQLWFLLSNPVPLKSLMIYGAERRKSLNKLHFYFPYQLVLLLLSFQMHNLLAGLFTVHPPGHLFVYFI